MFTRIRAYFGDFRRQMTLLASIALCLVVVAGVSCFEVDAANAPKVVPTSSVSVAVENFTPEEIDSLTVIRDCEDSKLGNLSDEFQVTVVRNGESSSFLTSGETVGELLDRVGMTLELNEECEPSSDAQLRKGTIIHINSVMQKRITVDETICREIEAIDDPNLPYNNFEVIVPGSDGKKTCTYDLVFNKKGKLVSQTLVKEEIHSLPVTSKIRQGKYLGGILTLPDGTRLRYQKRLYLQATAYNSFNTSNCTATGTRPRRGTIAVDRRVIPLGTKMYVVSPKGGTIYGYGVAEDTGVIGNRVDLYMETMRECYEFGRRFMYVYILAD